MANSVLRSVIQPKLAAKAAESEAGSGGVDPSADLEQVLGVLVENAPVAMAMFDRNMRYILANRQWVEEFGLQATQPLIGRSQYEVFPGLHPGWRQVYERALQGHVVRSEHDAMADQEGRRIVYRWEVRPWRRHQDAAVEGLMIICEKFTQSSASEAAEAKTVGDSVPSTARVGDDYGACMVPMVQFDNQGVIHAANEAAVDLCLARGIQEGASPFWEAFASNGEAASLRQRLLECIRGMESAPPGAQVRVVELAHGKPGGGQSTAPRAWLVAPASGKPNRTRYVAIGLNGAPADLEPSKESAAAPLLANGADVKPAPAEQGALGAGLEIRRLQDDLARSKQELRTLHEAEKTFSKREQKLSQYLDALPTGVLVLDELGVAMHQNEPLARLLGRPVRKDETVEQWLAAGCPNDDHRQEVERVWRDDVWRRQLTRTLSLATADGLLKELEFRPLSLAGGGTLVTIQDVTEVCRHEEQLRATEAKFRTLLHEAPVPIVLMDRVGAVFEVNHLAEELLGRPKAELRRFPLDAWLTPESGAARREVVRNLDGEEHRGATLPVVLRHPDDQSLTPAVLHVAQVADPSGEAHCTIHFLQKEAAAPSATPATGGARRESTNQEISATGNSRAKNPVGPVPVPFVETNVNGRIRQASAEALALLGMDEQAARGTPLHFFFRPSDATGFYAELGRLAQSPQAWHELNFFDTERNSHTRAFQVHAGGGGGLDYELEVARMPAAPAEEPDSEMPLLAEAQTPALEASPARLAGWGMLDLSREKLLLTETHHRIKNHLQIISSLLNLGSNTLTDETARRALVSGQNRVRSIAELHQHLYQVALGTADDLGKFAEALVQRLRECYETEPDRVAVTLELDHGPVQQEWLMPLALTLNEAVSNCFEHGFPDGRGGEVKVCLKLAASEGLLTVADNGVGLPEGFRSTEQRGLGLKILAVFAEQMRGKFRIFHKEDGGTKIELRFPIAFVDN